ncbi:hypothetical protein EAS62_17275 [Bradyrhizobium zhanjiangense]|uniref:Uncharacterized protein n=1 Tax=Bradyrhizobium zhanjiangense TaxID=1325107 RepID=A0ABY0DK53_9BRAD|nr:hypothetical protein EAS62_17275 [Bradyrhizobium zhanjiangense]
MPRTQRVALATWCAAEPGFMLQRCTRRRVPALRHNAVSVFTRVFDALWRCSASGTREGGALLPQTRSLRAQRSNPDCHRGGILDCFVARAPRNDGAPAS